MTTYKYYLSYTNPNSEDTIDNSNQYMLFDNKPKITRQSLLNYIDIITEVTHDDFTANKINNYLL